MALTIGTPSYWIRPGVRGIKVGTVDITFDSAYAAGGEALVYSDIPGLDSSLEGLTQIATNDDAYHCHYDSTAGTLVANAVAAEAAGDRSGLTVKVLFLGY